MPTISDLVALIQERKDRSRLRSNAEDLREIANEVFPLKPGEEGYFSDECEWVVGAFNGHTNFALKVKDLLGPGWLVGNLAQRPDGAWWCSVDRPVERDEAGAVLREAEHGEACDRSCMAQALLLASLVAMRDRDVAAGDGDA